jgi:hypothetical protein
MLAEIDTLVLFGSFTGIIIALQSVFFIVIIEWVKAHTAPLNEHLKQKIAPHPATEYSLAAFTDIVVEMENMLEVHTGLIHHLASASPIIKNIPNLSDENRKLRDRLEKTMQELMLISSNEERRNSAIQQLSQTIGDQRSLDKLKEAAKLFPNDVNIAPGIRDLTNRLT